MRRSARPAMPLPGYGEPLRGWPTGPAPTAKPRKRGYGLHGRLDGRRYAAAIWFGSNLRVFAVTLNGGLSPTSFIMTLLPLFIPLLLA